MPIETTDWFSSVKEFIYLLGAIGGLGWLWQFLVARFCPLRCEVHASRGADDVLDLTVVNVSKSPVFVRSIDWISGEETPALFDVRVLSKNQLDALAPGELRTFQIRGVQEHVQTARALVVRPTIGRRWRLPWWRLRRFSYNYDMHRALLPWRTLYGYYIDEIIPGRAKRVRRRTDRQRDAYLANLRAAIATESDLPANHMAHPLIQHIAEMSIVERHYFRDGHPAHEAFQDVHDIYQRELDARAGRRAATAPT